MMDAKTLYNIYLEHPVVITDSRQCQPGSIFFALHGESFDGNNFAVSALEQGCAYAVVDNPKVVVPGDNRYLLVNDTLQAFKDLAREHRRHFSIPVIGITGTNGKTTTKELIAAVLKQQYHVMATEGNFNNDVGVPKTLFRLTNDDEIAVVEMGASHPGDIKTLVETAEPTCGIISNVGRAHLEGFGSFEGVKRTKGELYDFLAAQNHTSEVFINGDDADLMEMFNRRCSIAQGKLMPYIYSTDEQQTNNAYVVGKLLSCNPCLRMAWKATTETQWHEVQTHLIGAYNISNVLAAATIGLHFGVSPEQISLALEQYEPSNNRSQLVETAHNRLIVDAYNANPTSMQAAIENFFIVEGQHKMLILGDMKELGEASHEAHQQIVQLLQNRGFNEVWLVGEEFGKVACNYRKFQDVEEVKTAISVDHPSGKFILVKGSNSTRLAQLKDFL